MQKSKIIVVSFHQDPVFEIKVTVNIIETYNIYSQTSVQQPPLGPKKTVVVVARRLLFSGYLRKKISKCDLKMVVVTDRWSLFESGR